MTRRVWNIFIFWYLFCWCIVLGDKLYPLLYCNLSYRLSNTNTISTYYPIIRLVYYWCMLSLLQPSLTSQCLWFMRYFQSPRGIYLIASSPLFSPPQKCAHTIKSTKIIASLLWYWYISLI